MADVETVFLPEEKIRAWGRLVFKECGLPDNEAADVLDALVSSNLRGVDTHGINLARFYAERYKAVPHREITTEIDLPAFCKINGGNNMGPVVGTYAMKKAMEKADICGVGMALVLIRAILARQDIIPCRRAERLRGIFNNNGRSLLAPWGGLDMKVSNCPFSFPSRRRISRGAGYCQFRHGPAENHYVCPRRQTLPEGWAMDTEGNRPPTRRKPSTAF
jgi:LDH2 family malate/lactate/ureidoglycolate dehydrogenase